VSRLGALEALGRGISNVRANWEVVAVATAGSLASIALLVLALVPWLSAFGVGVRDLFGARRPGLAGVLGAAAGGLDPRQLVARLGAGAIALLLALLLGSVLYAWYYAGMVGVLVAGDAQAPAGAHRAAGLFRTWSWRFFLSEATRLTWKMLVYLSVILTLLGVAVILALALLLLAAEMVHGRGAVPAAAIGCGGMLPLLFAMLAIWGAGCVGLGELARPGSSVGSAVRLGFQVFGARLGACLALLALFVVASLAVAIVCGSFELLFASAGLARRAVVEVAALVVQAAAGALLGSVFMASCVALLRSEPGSRIETATA